MYPTIFALGIRGLGDHTKFGSSLIVMSIVVGAIAAPFIGRIADTHSMRTGFVVRSCALSSLPFTEPSGKNWKRRTARSKINRPPALPVNHHGRLRIWTR